MELASKDSCTDCGNCRLEQISKLNNISAVGKKCCGCTACVNVCPQKVIYMVENSEGLYDSYFKKDRALSIVGVNTERGKHLFGNLKNVDFIKADYLKECSVNAQMNHPTARPDERDNFYIALFQNGYSEKNADEYKYRYSFKENVKNWITLNTTPSFRNKLKKLLKSNEN